MKTRDLERHRETYNITTANVLKRIQSSSGVARDVRAPQQGYIRDSWVTGEKAGPGTIWCMAVSSPVLFECLSAPAYCGCFWLVCTRPLWSSLTSLMLPVTVRVFFENRERRIDFFFHF